MFRVMVCEVFLRSYFNHLELILIHPFFVEFTIIRAMSSVDKKVVLAIYLAEQ